MSDAQLRLPFDGPQRHEFGYVAISRGDGVRWVLGERCIDLSWPWWKPWDVDELWPNGNQPPCERESPDELMQLLSV